MAGIERGSIRATVLIEILPAVFQMSQVATGYIFSYVKTFRAHPDRLLPVLVQVGMSQHFMNSYSDLLIRTCHRRGVHAMGGMVCNLSYLTSLIMQRMFLWNLIRCMYKTLFVLPVHIKEL
jgi:malate synthase